MLLKQMLILFLLSTFSLVDVTHAVLETAQGKDFSNFSKPLANHLNSIKSLSKELVILEKTPVLTDFYPILFIEENLEKDLAESPQEKVNFLTAWNKLWLDIAKLRETKKTANGQSNFQSQLEKLNEIEIRFRRAYDKDLVNLSHKLRHNKNPLLEPIHFPTNTEELHKNNQAEKIVADLTRSLDANFSSTGFSNNIEFLEAIKSGGADLSSALAIVENENFEVAMKRTEGKRSLIMRTGFFNIHVAKTSGGWNQLGMRNAIEAILTKIKNLVYTALDPDLKPKYTYLLPKLNSAFKRKTLGYGEDFYIFDIDKIRTRMTFTIGDSAESGADFEKNLRVSAAPRPVIWDDQFIPWNRRVLMVPWLRGIEQVEFGPTNNELKQKLSQEKSITASRIGTQYVEVQVFGSLTLDHVKAFVFSNNPPTGEFLRELNARKILILKTSPTGSTYTPWKSEPRSEHLSTALNANCSSVFVPTL